MAAVISMLTAVALCDVTPTVTIAPGVEMPVVNLGGVGGSHASNYTAFLAAGGVGIDTANTYGTQKAVGKAIKESGLPRDKIFVTTKIPCCPIFSPWTNPHCKGITPDDAPKLIEQNLQEMEINQTDLLLLHWPCETFEDTLKTYQYMETALANGQTKAIGVSNFNVTLMKQILGAAKVKPAVNQCGYSIANHNISNESYLGRNDATREFCTANNVWYQAYSPLGGLSGVDVLGNPVVKQVAATHNVSTAQVALRWVAQQQSIFVTAADNVEYIKEDLDIFNFELSSQEMTELSNV